MSKPVVTRIMALHSGTGPTHALYDEGLTWCGVKPQFRHACQDGTVDQVDCPRCATALRAGGAKAWRKR